MSFKLAILFATLAYVSAGHLESPLQVPYYTTTPATYNYGTAPAISYADHTYGHSALAYGNNYVALPYGQNYGYSGYGHSVAPLTTYPTLAARGYGYANNVNHGSYGHYAY